jgi:L-fuculose-phosphate aldolase
MYTTALSTVIDELPAIHYVIARLGGPVRVAPYATPGSLELARRFEAGLEGRTGVILANHGAVTVGGSLQEAYARSVTLEWLAQLYFTASVLGRRPAIVSAEQVNELMQRLERRKGGGAA